MKKSSRRRRFFALDERTPGSYLKSQQHNPVGSAQPTEEELAEEFEEEEGEANEEVSEELPQGRQGVESSEEGELPPAFALSRIPRERSQKKRGVPVGGAVGIALVCLLVGGLCGYLWPKAAKNEEGLAGAANSAVKVKPLTAAEQEQLNSAYEARHEQRYEAAEKQFLALSQEHPEWKWLEIERVRTLLFQGKMNDVRRILQGAMEKSLQPAETNYLMAAMHMVERDYSRAEDFFASAVAIDPSRPEYYYLWGDCLRSDGKPLEAAGKFRAALFSNTFEINDPFYRVKWWLCQIDADQENTNGLSTNLDTELARPRPSMPVLFASAARAIKGGDFKTAATYLRQAQVVTDTSMFHILLNDPIFRQASSRPELAELFRAE